MGAGRVKGQGLPGMALTVQVEGVIHSMVEPGAAAKLSQIWTGIGGGVWGIGILS